MKPSEALKACKKYLYYTGVRRLGCEKFICQALAHVRREWEVEKGHYITNAQSELMMRIRPFGTLAGFLNQNGKFPRECLSPTGSYNLEHPTYINLRDEFLNNLITELQKDGL